MKKKIIVLILFVLYLSYLLKHSIDEIKTYDNMTLEERIRTEQSIIPGW